MTYLNYFATKFTYAINGLKYIIRNDKSVFIHLVCTFLVIVLSLYFNISRLEWMFVLSAVFLVIFAEIINSVIELICDFIEEKQNKKIAIIKDLMAGAVLFISIYAAIIGFFVFYPKLKQLLEVKI
tara:strand:+ start:1486 stop:1863 length:378 start_codon:yes stop_codon:yes gene_type:complete